MKIEIWKSKYDGQWYAHLVSCNGLIVASSEGYQRSNSATRWARNIKKAADAKVVRVTR